jgi:hypothetical protein
MIPTPNHFHLEGHGWTVDYYPDGKGPLKPPPLAELVLDHEGQKHDYAGASVKQLNDAMVGVLVEVELLPLEDAGAKTFSLIIPHIQMGEVIDPPNFHPQVEVQTTGLKTWKRGPDAPRGPGQLEKYEVIPLAGHAISEILPDAAAAANPA